MKTQHHNGLSVHPRARRLGHAQHLPLRVRFIGYMADDAWIERISWLFNLPLGVAVQLIAYFKTSHVIGKSRTTQNQCA